MAYLYGRYVERFLRLRLAVDGCDAPALARIDGEVRGLHDRERRAASMAIVDVAAGQPMRGELGFARAFDDVWRGDHEFFVHLLEALRCSCPPGAPFELAPGPPAAVFSTPFSEPPARSSSVP